MISGNKILLTLAVAESEILTRFKINKIALDFSYVYVIYVSSCLIYLEYKYNFNVGLFLSLMILKILIYYP